MAKDKYHELIKQLLEEDGWVITHDPLYVRTGLGTVEIDLGAEKLIGAEKEGNKIAVEVKSFIGHSKLHDLYKALGQFVFYLPALKRQEPNRILYLAIPQTAYDFFFSDHIAEEIVSTNQLKFVVYDKTDHKIILWT